ncbi:DUF4876 domain-containing protein [Gynurincola endophyticus]|uniref:DUF4876 domain-containing protein n=1 Tax=Gynurincola endophyticus TaxID=2479004 RepID=UPI00131599B1|nr:DUF4876 domain-containing protein [Gynurincola endophyticus]
MRISAFLLFLCGTIAVTSCQKNNDVDNGVNYAVTVNYPATYNAVAAAEVTVVLKNLTTNQQTALVTNAAGTANFEGLTPGNYSITVSKELSTTAAEALTGVAQEVFLNATEPQVQIIAEGSKTITLTGSAIGGWVIKEFYYSGAPNSFYFYDAFIEIYNNSTDTLYADGLLIGNTKASSSSTTAVYGFIAEGRDDVYLATILRIPGSGKEHPVAPGKSIVIATDAINHKDDPNGNANSPVNLGQGIADFEVFFYVNPNTPDTDNPDVPNVDILHSYSTTLFDYLPGVFGSGLVIFEHSDAASLPKFTEPNTTSSSLYAQVPKASIIDGVDAVANSNIRTEQKRLPIGIDAGMNTVGSTYTGTSLRRKVKQEINGRKILQDTNNSSNDFEVANTPTPKGW